MKTENINSMVRDFCSVVPRSKSEVRERLLAFEKQVIERERDRILELIDEFNKADAMVDDWNDLKAELEKNENDPSPLR